MKINRLISTLLAAAMSFAALAGCSNAPASSAAPSSSEAPSSEAASPEPSSAAELKKLVVGASPTPHALILKEAAKLLKEKGYDLDVKEFSDYVLPNTALSDKQLDANYFQHQPYLDEFNKEKGTDIVSAGSIHYEPFGIYAGKTKSLDELKDGADITATQKDISENKKNLKFKEIEAAQLVRALPDVDLAIINGNYALEGGLKVADALAVEADDSIAAATYANIIAVRKGDENREDIKALVEVLKSDEIKKYINDNFDGAVVPVK